jgi:hypothetical protein
VQEQLGGTRAFQARIAGRGGSGFKEFDGAYKNGRVWFEAKNSTWQGSATKDFFEQANYQIRIAQAAGREYQLISRYAIPEEVKQWLTARGATYLELPMP